MKSATLLPDALGDALGRVIADARREARAEIETIKALHRAEFAEFQARTINQISELKALVQASVAALEDALLRVKDGKDGADGVEGPQGEPGPAGVNGKDADPEVIKQFVADEVAKIELPQGLPGPQGEPGEKGDTGLAGKDVDVNFVAARIDLRVKEAVAELPPPEKGEPGKDADPIVIKQMVDEVVSAIPRPKDGEDGMSVALDDMLPMVEEAVQKAVSELPPPKDGKDGEPGAPGEKGERGVSIEWVEIRDGNLVVKWSDDDDNAHDLGLVVGPAGEKGADGQDGSEVDYDLILRMIEDQVKEIPQAKDGIGMAGLVIDRTGCCIATMTDGTIRELGPIVGRDGLPGADGRDGKDGRDGLSIEDLSGEFDGERTLTLRFARGETVKEIPVTFPVPIDRGIYRETNGYAKGDGVTYGGSFWICQKDVPEGKPDAGTGSWRLAVKHGRDGKLGEKGERGPDGRPGKDFTVKG